jgi:transcriptional regulator with XRE-family HTH domain
LNQSEPIRPRSFAEKLDFLFRTVRPRGRGEYSYRDVAQAINDSAEDTTISASYIWQLRKGEKNNPSVRHAQALAKFFGVPPTYFLNEVADDITAQLELLAAIRDSDVR